MLANANTEQDVLSHPLTTADTAHICDCIMEGGRQVLVEL